MLPPKVEHKPETESLEQKPVDHEMRSLYRKRRDLQKQLENVTRMIEVREGKRKLEVVSDMEPQPKRRKVQYGNNHVVSSPELYYPTKIEPKEDSSPIQSGMYLGLPFGITQPSFVHGAQPRSYKNLLEPALPTPVQPAEGIKFTHGGKRNGMIIRCRLFCSHCQMHFYAKPTARKSFYVLNHQCSGDKRKQYVIGKHHRKCRHDHYPSPCICFAPRAKGCKEEDMFELI